MTKGSFVLGLIIVLAFFPISMPLILCGVCDDKAHPPVVEPDRPGVQAGEPTPTQPTQKEVADDPVNI